MDNENKSPMSSAPIVVELAGGLGNQLFQYNLGLFLSQLSKRNLLLDVTSIKRDVQRHPDIMQLIPPTIYEMGIELGYITKRKHLYSILQSRVLCSLNWFERLINMVYPYHQARNCDTYQFFYEKSTEYQNIMYLYDDNIQSRLTEEQTAMFCSIVNKNTAIPLFVRGYWQDMRLYYAVKERKENFYLHAQQSNKIANIEKDLQQQYDIDFSHAAVIHVRRTDFVFNQYPKCSLEYYRKAVKIILDRDPKVKFFVFTDDIYWCVTHLDIGVAFILIADKSKLQKKNISLTDGVKIYTNNFSTVDEMILMNSCVHYIHSNSSFAWWGARLKPKRVSTTETVVSKETDSVIVAPFPWFEKRTVATSLYNTQWHILDTSKGTPVLLQKYTQE